jgi:hypothetical protein
MSSRPTERAAGHAAEVPDPGARSHRPDPARHTRARHPRLPPRRHLQPLRRAEPHHRPGHRPAAVTPPRDRVQRGSSRRSIARSPTTSTSTSCWTPPPHTRRRRSSAGPPRTRDSSILHFTPTSSSWLNLVERWVAELTTKLLRRGAHRSVRQLNTDIRAWIKTWNDDPRPCVWTKTADEILDSIARYCQRINASRHVSPANDHRRQGRGGDRANAGDDADGRRALVDARWPARSD